MAMIIDHSGAFWIADHLAVDGRRLVRVDPVEDAIEVIEMVADDVITILDIAEIPGGLAALWIDAFGRAFIEILDDSGSSTERMRLDPVDFGWPEGLSLATVQDRLYVEQSWGVHAALLHVPYGPGEILRGYDTPYGFYSIRPIRTPEATIPFQVEGWLGTVMLVGVNPDGSLVVKVDDLSEGPSHQLLVDQDVLWYRRDGTLAGAFEFPLDEQAALVEFPTCLGDDGYVYGLLTRRDHAEIVRFNYSPGT